MSPVHAPRRSRFAGRQLSFGRLALSVAVVVTLGLSATAAALVPTLPPAVTGADAAHRWFAPYYDVTLESGDELSRSTMNDAPGGLVLAFVVAAGDDDCTPTWGRTYTLDDAAQRFQLDRRVERMHREGRPLAVSFGGALNTELASACATVDALATAYGTVLDRYGIDTVDLDIERDALDDAAATARRAAAIAQLQKQRSAEGTSLQVWLTLPVAPDGLTAQGSAQVSAMLDGGAEIAGVNAMTMDFNADDHAASTSSLAISALNATARQVTDLWSAHGRALPPGGAWALLGATPMIGQSDIEREVFTLDDARALAAFASAQGIARMSMWSVNRDRTCGSNYPLVHRVSPQCSGIDQAGVSFAGILADGHTGTPSGEPVTPHDGPVVPDDAVTSPFPLWTSQSFYSAGVFVVWRGSVYVSKWWNEDGPQPDDPSLDAAASAWTYVGPVLSTDRPFTLPQLPEGTYPEWSATALYNQGDRVMYDGSGYEARWWSRGQRPDRSVLDHDYSPWKLLDGS